LSLQVSVVEKSFQRNGNSAPTLAGVSFEVPPGTIVGLYGPSGCGKSTLLRIVAGLDIDYQGTVELNGEPVTHPTRRIGMTVQTLISYDWLSVGDNITFGLRYAKAQNDATWFRRVTGKVDPQRAQKEAERLAAIVGLARSDLAKYPDEISGGMKQRMAFARSLLPRPQVLLLDEPFSALDFESRQSLEDAVLRVRDELGTSFICVSHDPEEILYLADEVLVLGGAPAHIVHRFEPELPCKGTDEKRYTQEFQQAKKELYGWLNPSTTT
jgi:sulfonate transport system ATP-binding protein